MTTDRDAPGPILSVRALRKEYPAPDRPLVVLDGLDLDVAPGESVAVMGPSGSGKSTFLQIVGTLDEPTSGEVLVGGDRPFALLPDARADFRNRRVGFVFQDHHLLPQLNVLENVLVPTLVSRAVAPDVAEARARALLERVGLAARERHRPAELSGGERQRVAIARALIHSPPLLLCDEPTGNLDRKTASVVGELFAGLRAEERVATVVVTHSAEFAALSDRRYELIEGRLEPVA